MIKLMKSKKGSSSILVVLLMVVLVVFGIAALTTALSGMRLGQKAAAYTGTCYAAEAAASECFAEIDKAVASTDGSTDAVCDALAGLGFDAQAAVDGSTILITYEAWENDIGILAALSMTGGNPGSLHVTEWIQTTRND